MSQRKAWTLQEDNALKCLFEERGITKWADIARLMDSEFKIQGRSGKQCRERYHNHLDSSIKHDKWTKQEEVELINIHNGVGNRWAEISRALTGRSQNCVKNKFYSILRRGLRHLNLVIKSKLKRYRQLQIGIIYKIVEACEHNYRKKSLTKEMIGNFELKKNIIHYAMNQDYKKEEQIAKIKQIVQKIKKFTKSDNPVKKNGQEKSHQTVQKQEDEPSEEIESSEYRDNYPYQLLQPHKASIHNFMLQPLDGQQQQQVQKVMYSKSPSFFKTISNQSNQSVQITSPRPYELNPLDPSYRSFQFPQHDNTKSPRPLVFVQSPYFDQMKNTFTHWPQFYPR